LVEMTRSEPEPPEEMETSYSSEELDQLTQHLRNLGYVD
jgi:hypothetical protein